MTTLALSASATTDTIPASATCSIEPDNLPLNLAACAFPAVSNAQSIVDSCANGTYGFFNNGCSIFIQAIDSGPVADDDDPDWVDILEDCIQAQGIDDDVIYCDNEDVFAPASATVFATGTAATSTTTNSATSGTITDTGATATCSSEPTFLPVANAACGWPASGSIDTILSRCCSGGISGIFNGGCSLFCQPVYVNGNDNDPDNDDDNDDVIDDLEDCLQDAGVNSDQILCNSTAPVATTSSASYTVSTSGVSVVTNAAVATITGSGTTTTSTMTGSRSGSAASVSTSGNASVRRVEPGMSKVGLAFAGLVVSGFFAGTMAL